jgi:hypothetical protein
MARVVVLVDGPLSDHEALVMYATAVAGVEHTSLASLTGLTDTDVQAAVAQLTRRGLLSHLAGAAKRPAEHPLQPPAA